MLLNSLRGELKTRLKNQTTSISIHLTGNEVLIQSSESQSPEVILQLSPTHQIEFVNINLRLVRAAFNRGTIPYLKTLKGQYIRV